VSKRFGEVVSVNNANLKIGEGEFFSVLGPSGCGKTTLLRMLAGFETPSEGEIYIDGKPDHKIESNDLADHLEKLIRDKVKKIKTDSSSLIVKSN